MAGQPIFYGSWRPKWAANEHDFDVEVVGYGWASRGAIGDPDPATRRRLPAQQASDVRTLVSALFESVEARNGIVPFATKTARFMGKIAFRENWILVAN